MSRIAIHRQWTVHEADLVFEFLHMLADAVWLAHEIELAELARAELLAQDWKTEPQHPSPPSVEPTLITPSPT